MKKIICDRCGNEIKDTYIFDPNDIHTHYDINAKIRTTVIPYREWTIDLCPSCEKELSEWLNKWKFNSGKEVR